MSVNLHPRVLEPTPCLVNSVRGLYTDHPFGVVSGEGVDSGSSLSYRVERGELTTLAEREVGDRVFLLDEATEGRV